MQGFDVSLIDLVADDLGVKQTIVDQPFENFKTGGSLNAGQCDLAAAGMTITEERKKNVDFSDPYFEATQAVLVDKKSGITSFADLKGKKVGAQAQTTGEDYAKSKGLDPVSFESSDAVLNGLRTGQVEAVVIDYPVVQGWLKDKANAAAFEVVEQHQHRRAVRLHGEEGQHRAAATPSTRRSPTPRPTARTRSCTRSGSARTTSPRPPPPPSAS